MCVYSFDHNFYYINYYIKARKLELTVEVDGENDATICAENQLAKVVPSDVEPAGVFGQLLSPI